jgi:hypothetical protein
MSVKEANQRIPVDLDLAVLREYKSAELPLMHKNMNPV